MSATPALENSIFGRYQLSISNAFYLDHKESTWVLTELKKMALELLADRQAVYVSDDDIGAYSTDADTGDENA